jgi:hypothetical protein
MSLSKPPFLSWMSNHASRRFTMSRSSCSLAWAAFFPGNVAASKEASQCANGHAILFI